MLDLNNNSLDASVDASQVEHFIQRDGLKSQPSLTAGVSGGLLSVSAPERADVTESFADTLVSFFEACPSALHTIEDACGLERNVLTEDFMTAEEFNEADFAMARNAGNAVGTVLVAATNPDEFFTTCLDTKAFAETDGNVLAEPLVQSGFGNLSFSGPGGGNKAITGDLLMESVSLAIRQSTSSDLEALNFPTVLVPADKPGIAFSYSETNIINASKVVNSAAANQITRRSINDATLDRSLLKCDTLKLIPTITATDAADYLMDVNDYPNKTVEVKGAGVSVKTRPILFGKEVNILSLCNDPALKLGEVNATDELSAIAALGVVTVKLAVADADGTTGLKETFVDVDTTGMVGSMFHPSIDGSSNEFKLSFRSLVRLPATTLDISGVALHTALGLDTRASGTDGKYTVDIMLEVTGRADKDGNVVFNAMAPVIKAINGAEVAGYSAVATAGGVTPAMDRLNLNARVSGVRLEIGSTRNMIYPVRVKSPLVTVAPRGAKGSSLSAAELTRGLRLQRNNESVDKMIETAELLKAESPVMYNTPAVMAGLVEPKIVVESLSLSSAAITSNTSEAKKAVSAAIVNALSSMIKRALLESGYARNLEATHGNSRNVRFNITTSEWIKDLIAESGEDNIFGPGVNYKIATTHAPEYEEMIHVTMSRVGGKANDMYSFGCYQMTPALVQEIENQTANGANYTERRMFRRDGHVIACPVMVELTVTDLKNVMVTKPVINTIK